MRETLHSTVLFHGALESDIQSLQSIEVLENHPVGWLGPGIYFWDNSSYAAERWAVNATKRAEILEKPCVGRLSLQLNENEWVDFNDPWMRAEFIDFTSNYGKNLGEDGLKEAWAKVSSSPGVSIWGFWLDCWIYYLEEIQNRTIRGLRAVIRHQGFTFSADVPRLEGHSVHSMKGLPRRKRSRQDSENEELFDGETRPRFPDVGIAWIIRCPDLIRDIACWTPSKNVEKVDV